MAAKPLPDADLLRQLLRYEPDTGKLFWRERSASHFPPSKHAKTFAATFNREMAGKEAFASPNGTGYLQGWIKGRKYRAHRVIWKMVTGNDPDTIDHINGKPDDNRWCNLRDASIKENSQNKSLSKINKSGTCGVFWLSRAQRWKAMLTVDGRNVYVGQFISLEDATLARKAAEREYGFHPNHGRPKAQEGK